MMPPPEGQIRALQAKKQYPTVQMGGAFPLLKLFSCGQTYSGQWSATEAGTDVDRSIGHYCQAHRSCACWIPTDSDE